jgi:hypothetical protein
MGFVNACQAFGAKGKAYEVAKDLELMYVRSLSLKRFKELYAKGQAPEGSTEEQKEKAQRDFLTELLLETVTESDGTTNAFKSIEEASAFLDSLPLSLIQGIFETVMKANGGSTKDESFR